MNDEDMQEVENELAQDRAREHANEYDDGAFSCYCDEVRKEFHYELVENIYNKETADIMQKIEILNDFVDYFHDDDYQELLSEYFKIQQES